MREPVKRFNFKSLMICMMLLVSIFVVEIVCAYAFVDDFSFENAPPKASSDASASDEYSDLGVKLDPNAVQGMIDPSQKTGVKKAEGNIAYKINVAPEFKNATAKGNLMIENHGDNLYLIKVRIDTKDGKTLYQSGFIAPDMHIPSAPLDVELEDGSYEAIANIEAYDMETQEYVGALTKAITIKVGK